MSRRFKDVPKLNSKIKFIRQQIDRFEKHLNGEKRPYETDYDIDVWSLMSEAMDIQRTAGEFVQNISTAWRKDLLAHEEKARGKPGSC